MTDEPKPEAVAQQRSDWDTIKEISAKIEDARKAGKFMVCVFHVDDQGKLTLNRACHDFPIVDFENSLNLLKQDMERERAGMVGVKPPEKMEQAEPAPPVIDLFGKPPANNGE